MCPPRGGSSWEHHLPCRHLLHCLSLPGTGQGLGTVCEEDTVFSFPSSSLGGSRFERQGHWVSMRIADVGFRGRAA